MTDIITNVIGGIIGYAIYLIFRPLLIKILKYIKHIQNAKERIRSNLCKNRQKTEKIRIVRHTY